MKGEEKKRQIYGKEEAERCVKGVRMVWDEDRVRVDWNKRGKV